MRLQLAARKWKLKLFFECLLAFNSDFSLGTLWWLAGGFFAITETIYLHTYLRCHGIHTRINCKIHKAHICIGRERRKKLSVRWNRENGLRGLRGERSKALCRAERSCDDSI